MVFRRLYITIVLCFLMFILASARPVDDKSSDRPILASERKKVERLIARAAYLESLKNDSCVVLATEALHFARAYNATVLEAKALDVIGNYYFDTERYRESLVHFNQLLPLYTQTGDSIAKANCYNRIGLANYNLGIYNEAIRSYHNAMHIASALNQTAIMAKCSQNIGVLYAEMKRPDEAMNYYKKALDLHRILKNRPDEAGVMQNIGNIYEDEKKYKDALGYYLSALRIYTNLRDSNSMATVYLSLGSLFEDQTDYDKSLDYYNNSLAIFQKENSQFGIAYGLISIGSVYYKKGEYEKAKNFLQRSLAYSKKISLVENEADCHRLLADVYYGLRDYVSAFAEKQEYEVLHDSLFSQTVQEQVAELELRYKTKLKDAEIENLKIEREKAVHDMIRRTIGLASIVLLTILIIVVYIYYSRILKRANDKLTKEVDERTRAQQELITIKESLEERVVERTRELEVAKLKAEESDKLKSAFIANMSHEIRTPLNAITGFSGLLLREDISHHKKQEYNDQIIKNNRILVNMIEDLIDTSRIESGSLQLHPSSVNPEQILSQMNEPIFENMAKKNKPFIEIIQDKVNINTPTIYADPVRLHQVLWHLLDNAVKFTNKGSIHFGCNENHHSMIFYVNDTGIGIPEEFKSVIFDKFRQLDESAKRKYGGTGLGLYYARKIAEMMGGDIWFESKPDGGSIFYFSVPIIQK
jgi:signal transduction histidine kinase